MADLLPDPAILFPAARDRGAVTLRDVAQLAGVSMMTVSRAISCPQQVSAVTLQRVSDAVQAMGYVPNLVAGGLRASRSYLVTALVPTTTGSLFREMVDALTAALDARGYQLMLGQIGYSRSREDELLRAIIGRRPDGIVLTGVIHSDEGRRMLLASGIPVVETWDYTDQPIDMLVGLSHQQLGEEVCDYLVSQGRRRPALLSGDDERAARRRDGFLRASSRHGLAPPPMHFEPAPTTHAQGRLGLAKLLLQDPSIDSVFCSSDMLALGVLTEARARGIAVPGQLAVVGFGDSDFAASVSPSLSTVRIDGTRIGETAARFLVDRAEGRHVPQPVVDIGFAIVRRESA